MPVHDEIMCLWMLLSMISNANRFFRANCAVWSRVSRGLFATTGTRVKSDHSTAGMPVRGENPSLIPGKRAQVMATLRNLVLGLFEIYNRRCQAGAPQFTGWRRKMSGSQGLRLLSTKSI